MWYALTWRNSLHTTCWHNTVLRFVTSVKNKRQHIIAKVDSVEARLQFASVSLRHKSLTTSVHTSSVVMLSSIWRVFRVQTVWLTVCSHIFWVHSLRLRSASSPSLVVRRTRLSTYGDRAFPVAASRVWNSLPHHVTSAQSLPVFCTRLKTYLFSRSFPWQCYCCACEVTLVILDTLIVFYLLTYLPPMCVC